MPQTAPAELAEAELVVRAQQRVEARHLIGTHDAHEHRAQRNRFGGHLPELCHNRTCFSTPFSRPRNRLNYTPLHTQLLKIPDARPGGLRSRRRRC